jgi:N-dimethylarginine dimethylaminohydrolase
MSLMSMLDEETILVDLPLLSVETFELFQTRGFRLAGIEACERATLAANVLSLGNGRLLALEQNPRTNDRLRNLGFEVITFSGAEIGITGGGGPTCLTRPLLRI